MAQLDRYSLYSAPVVRYTDYCSLLDYLATDISYTVIGHTAYGIAALSISLVLQLYNLFMVLMFYILSTKRISTLNE
jgi:hypothetical protein